MPGGPSAAVPGEPSPSPLLPREVVSSTRLPALNVSMSWASQLVAIAGSFVVTPVLIHGLGEALYGAWVLINAFTSQLRALDLGMSAGTLKFSAGALARGDWQRLRRIHSSSVAMFLLAASVALLATGALAHLLPRAFPEALAGQRAVILVLGAAVSLDLLLHPQVAGLRSRSYYFIPDFVELVAYSIFKLGLVLYLARTGLSLQVLCLLILGESVARNLAVSLSGLALCPWTRHPGKSLVDRGMLRTLAAYGGGMFLINLGEIVRFQLDAAVIGYFLTAEAIAVYSIGVRLIHVAYQAIGVIGAVAVPRFSGLHEGGDRQGYERLLGRANLVTDLAAAYFLVNIALLGLPFLRLWIGKPWVEEAFQVTLIMLPAYFVGLLSGPGVSLLVGAGKLRGLTTLTLVEAGCNLGLSVMLVRWLGLYGVCLGTAIPMAVFRGLVFPLVLRRHVEVPVGTYYRSHMKGVALAVAYALLVLPVQGLELRSARSFVAAGLATTAVFAALLLLALPEARAWLRARVGRAPRR